MGTDMLYDAGYDPRALPQFFETIQAKYGSGGAQFLSDHPNPGNRIGYVNAEIATLPPRRNFIKTTDAFRRIHDQATKMHAYTAAEIKAGSWKVSQRQPQSQQKEPSFAQAPACTARADRKAFVHNAYNIDYPADWQINGDASAAVVTITPPDGIDQAGNIACGLLIGRQETGGSGTVEDQMRALEQQIMKQDPNMRQVDPDDDVIVNKINGRTAEFLTKSPLSTSSQAVQERDWLVALLGSNGNLTYVVFVAPENQFETLRPVFESVLRTFVVRE
jgi:predicted Zn-dependent protease